MNAHRFYLFINIMDGNYYLKYFIGTILYHFVTHQFKVIVETIL